MATRHGWAVGRYVIMPDHVHFFVRELPDHSAKPLGAAIGRWKERMAKRIRLLDATRGPLWQPEFFDHVMRSDRSVSEKWDYVKNNPVRAGLVTRPDDWPFQGFIDFE